MLHNGLLRKSMKQREGNLIQVVGKHRQITTHLKEMF